ncbi:MAG: CHAT domain-containing protein, partial [Chitinophagaceae bacterium]
LNGNSPQILHIATHGFFLPEPDKKREENNFSNENTYTLADDPLLRSGLILAGGNYAWSGKTPIDGVEDGIATAYEISQLNLSNTELVVLSACETALGDVKGSEGVFGLQRAFKMAGVKKMIVSLWQVPDKETAELMTTFYNYWMKGKTINDAFTQAQADMRKKYAPFYWAAFVLVE